MAEIGKLTVDMVAVYKAAKAKSKAKKKPQPFVINKNKT